MKKYSSGGGGVAGKAIMRNLEAKGFQHVLTPSHEELDMQNGEKVYDFFQKERPDYVFYTAAKMGSIVYRKSHPAELLLDNIQMQNNVIRSAHIFGVKKLLFMSSDFIYPNTENGTLHEEDFLTGLPSEKDFPYSLAKITGVKLCDYYREEYGDQFFTVVPCAFFGIDSSYDVERANVVMSLVRRMHDAKIAGDAQFVLWGTGKPVKEFLFSDDVASACVLLMENDLDCGLYNIGSGSGGTSILELANMVREVVGYTGQIVCDPSKPDGNPRRVPDSSRLRTLGWKPNYELKDALTIVYAHFLTIYEAKRNEMSCS